MSSRVSLPADIPSSPFPQIDPELLVYVNGESVPATRASVSVFDSGLNFADGVFEGIRVYGRRVFQLDEHLDRLYESANALAIDVGLTKAEMRGEILGWLRANQVEDNFHFRPIVTRGNRFPPRLDPRHAQGPSTILFLGAAVQAAPPAGIRTIVSSVRRTQPDCLDPKIKSLNYGNNILARLEALRQGVDDALMLDAQGFMSEATAGNMFVVRSGRLLTPLPKACLEGITRGVVMELSAAMGYEVVERDISSTEVLNAQEIFLTGTAAEICPVVEVNGQRIGSGKPGPITQRLAEQYKRLVTSEGVSVW